MESPSLDPRELHQNQRPSAMFRYHLPSIERSIGQTGRSSFTVRQSEETDCATEVERDAASSLDERGRRKSNDECPHAEGGEPCKGEKNAMLLCMQVEMIGRLLANDARMGKVTYTIQDPVDGSLQFCTVEQLAIHHYRTEEEYPFGRVSMFKR